MKLVYSWRNSINKRTLNHPNLGTCDLGWSDGDVNQFSLNLPFSVEMGAP